MSGIFSKPKVTPPARMPVDQNDPAAKAAADEARRKIMARSGRDSTILTKGAQKPGSGGTTAYANTVLGQT